MLVKNPFPTSAVMASDIRPFRVNISQDEVDRYWRKIKDTRVPTKDIVPGAGDEYGFTTEWATNLYKYWVDDYDWRAQESFMNQWPHYLTDIQDQTIHFIHAKSEVANAIPILLIHGWPGSFFEFSQVINPLTKPSSPEQQPFHCIVPSLPGFCFSSGPPKGQTLPQVAELFHELMLRLGYHKYCVQAGDWGHWVARHLSSHAPYRSHILAMHTNWCPAPLLPDTHPSANTAREQIVTRRVHDWLHNHLAYAILMRTRPHTVGWMLTDNPVGIMTFVGEKYNEVANPAMQASRLWKDHILTTVSLYYFSNCIMTSCLPYFENIRHETFAENSTKPENRIVVPFGYTSFLYDTRPSSKDAVSQTGNLVFYRERDEAGHFAALEDPLGVVEDVRELVGMVLRGEVVAESTESSEESRTRSVDSWY